MNLGQLALRIVVSERTTTTTLAGLDDIAAVLEIYRRPLAAQFEDTQECRDYFADDEPYRPSTLAGAYEGTFGELQQALRDLGRTDSRFDMQYGSLLEKFETARAAAAPLGEAGCWNYAPPPEDFALCRQLAADLFLDAAFLDMAIGQWFQEP